MRAGSIIRNEEGEGLEPSVFAKVQRFSRPPIVWCLNLPVGLSRLILVALDWTFLQPQVHRYALMSQHFADKGSAGALPNAGRSADPAAGMAAPTDAQRSPDRTLTYAAIIIVAGVLATTLAQPQVLARLPLQNLLKNELHLDRSSNAAFFFWAGLAWYLKPLRRHRHRRLSALRQPPPQLHPAQRHAWRRSPGWRSASPRTPIAIRCCVAIVINVFMVVASAVVGGYMVETAQAVSGFGPADRHPGVRPAGAALIVSGPLAGYLASIAFGWTAAACGGMMFLLVPVTVLFLREQRQPDRPRQLLGNAASPAREYRDGANDVGCGGADGAVLHRARVSEPRYSTSNRTNCTWTPRRRGSSS